MLPDVFLRVLKVLQEEKRPIAWKMSKSMNGHIFLGTNHFPAEYGKSGLSENNASKIAKNQEITGSKLKPAPSKHKKKSVDMGKGNMDR